MASWIITKQRLLRKDSKSLNTRSQENDELGRPTGNRDIHWAHQYITTGVISSTASERIMDTLEFFPHTYQMQQLSSTIRLIMSSKDMINALQNPHPEVPFTHVGDDTISALTDLANFFKLKLRQTKYPTLPAAPPTVKPRPCLADHPIRS
jgi:hypothetical protein